MIVSLLGCGGDTLVKPVNQVSSTPKIVIHENQTLIGDISVKILVNKEVIKPNQEVVLSVETDAHYATKVIEWINTTGYGTLKHNKGSRNEWISPSHGDLTEELKTRIIFIYSRGTQDEFSIESVEKFHLDVISD